MAINIMDAQRLIDKELSDAQIELLLAAREGIPYYEAEGRTFDKLNELGLVTIVPFDHPRASNSINGVIPSEDGVKVLNELDNRKWADPNTSLSSDNEKTDDRKLLEKNQEVPKGVEAAEGVEYITAVDDQPFGAEVAPDKDGKPKANAERDSKRK